MSASRESVQAWMEAVARQQARGSEGPPDAAALKAVARELGLSEADLAEVDRAAEERFTRGRGFLEHALWDRAIEELAGAVALSPWRVDLVSALARAHLGRWRAHEAENDRAAAESLARRCLTLDPSHGPAFEVLAGLEQGARPAGRSRQGLRRLFQVCLGVSLAAAVYIYGVAFDRLSETMLVQLTGLWLYPFFFGAYGLVTDRLDRTLPPGTEPRGSDAFAAWIRSFALLALPCMLPYALLPFVFLRSRNPLFVAAAAVGFWLLAVQGFFFGGIWQAL